MLHEQAKYNKINDITHWKIQSQHFRIVYCSTNAEKNQQSRKNIANSDFINVYNSVIKPVLIST